MQRPSRYDVPGKAEVVIEVMLELEHVAKVVGTGETKGAIGRWRDCIINHFLA